MVNIAEILENAPKWLKLYSPLIGEVEFTSVYERDGRQIVEVSRHDKQLTLRLDEFGRFLGAEAECILLPSKDHRTWDNWQEVIFPQCVGSVITSKMNNEYRWLVTEKGLFALSMRGLKTFLHPLEEMVQDNLRFASPEKTEEFLKELDRQGYKFENGEVVVNDLKNMGCESWCKYDAKDGDFIRTYDLDTIIFSRISNGGAECYVSYNKKEDRLSIPKRGTFYFDIDSIYRPATQEEKDEFMKKLDDEGYVWNQEELRLERKDKEFTINDFKPFDKVLVRLDGYKWSVDFYSYFDREINKYIATSDSSWEYCIPYNEETAHLLGTTEEYNGKYKTWED